MPESWYFVNLDKFRRHASSEATLQEPFRTSIGMVLIDTAGFSAARGLLSGGTGGFGEDAIALLENG